MNMLSLYASFVVSRWITMRANFVSGGRDRLSFTESSGDAPKEFAEIVSGMMQ
jgi:hypothetical protein